MLSDVIRAIVSTTVRAYCEQCSLNAFLNDRQLSNKESRRKAPTQQTTTHLHDLRHVVISSSVCAYCSL